MDLRLFHPVEGPDRNYRAADKLNSQTRRLPCRLLEWTGWYNYSVKARLLGHYRLFKHFKAGYREIPKELSAERRYILQYRGLQPFKYFIARVVSLIYSAFTMKDHYPVVEIAAINRQLVNGFSPILEEFLVQADRDFSTALNQAVQKIDETWYAGHPPHQTITAKEAIKGKEAGVFSKFQVLILFDLLAECGKIERIDLKNPHRYEAIAFFFRAITGKSQESIIEEMQDCRTGGLYAYHTQGEFAQLIGVISNIGDKCRSAGFRSIATAADRKIKELEQQGKRDLP